MVAGIRARLGDERYEGLRAEGARLSLDQVLALVLDGDGRALEPVQERVQEVVEKS